MDTYTIVVGGRGGLPTTLHPLNTSSHNTAARRPPHPSYTQQHTTTIHNSTRVHKTTNVPVVFMALVLSGFLGPNGPTSGTKKVWIFRATPSNAPRNDVAPLKTITYCAIKTTGTLIVKTTIPEPRL
jgi:hypothetical protein